MQKINIMNHDMYYNDSEDPVISSLKNKTLFGYENYSLIKNYSKNDTGWIIDCGAHIGTFSFAPAIKKEKILLIEAAEENYDCLVNTFKPFDNTILENTIILDSVQKCDFKEKSGPFGSASINSNGQKESNTIDNLCSKHNIDDVSMIKYDIEGYEEEALLGSLHTLNKSKPVILLEINGHCLRLRNKKPKDTFEVLDNCGYCYFVPIKSGLLPIEKNKNFPFCVIDVISIHKDLLYKYIGSVNIHSKMDDNVISQLIYQNKNNSNQDCIDYFNTLS